MQHSKKTKKIGVLLLNLGGPEKQEDVRPFLFNLFSDRLIIRLGPAMLQKPIAALIARKRAPTSMANYQKIGGGSPIGTITSRQAAALEKMLQSDGDFIVRPCMRYWHPFARTVLEELAGQGVEEIIALPLYPHYSKATSGSSFIDLEHWNQQTGLNIPTRTIISWPAQQAYIDCLARRIEEGRQGFARSPQIVYSAHSLPRQFIDEGDPYVEELGQTIAALEQLTGHKGVLCYQSRSGPVQWLTPSTPDMLKKLANRGCKDILMVPISFVSDHIETLYEIDMLYKEQAAGLGMQLQSTKGLNDDPAFIKALQTLVLSSC